MKNPFIRTILSLAVLFLSLQLVHTASASTLRICSFNVENWGQKKSKDQVIMRKIAGLLSQCDLTAVQEISSIHEQVDPNCSRNQDSTDHDNYHRIRKALQKHLNQQYQQNFKFEFSQQVYDERYLYVYDPDKVTLLESYVVEDSSETGELCGKKSGRNLGKMVRQPFTGVFKAQGKQFILISVHTSPSIVHREMEALYDFYKSVKLQHNVSNVMILGDTNYDPSQDRPYSSKCAQTGGRGYRIRQDNNLVWIFDDHADTTVSGTNCSYDRMIMTKRMKRFYTGQKGIVEVTDDRVSDHHMIWASFNFE